MDDFDKIYDENYTRLLLEHIGIKVNCRTPDRPDLYSDELNLGIEVTRGESEYQGQLNTIFQTRELSEIIKRREKMKDFKEDFDVVDGVAGLDYHFDRDENSKIIIKIINGKIKKLANYHLYSSNQLFVFAGSLLFPTFLKDVIAGYNKEAVPNFDKIYFFTNPHLLIYTPLTNVKKEIVIDGKILDEIKMKALEISKGNKLS